MIRNALSFELEDWFHAETLAPRVIGFPPSRLAWEAEPILLLLQRYRVRATFFVVGDVLRHQPELVRRIYDAGHEIGCHGWSHRPLWSLDAARLAEELRAFDRDASSVLPIARIIGFRAPAFSLDERSAWALDVLREHGYRYDSSLLPQSTGGENATGGPIRPYRPASQAWDRDHADGEFTEFPLTVCHWAGLQVPLYGGLSWRLMPLPVLRYLCHQINTRGDPFVLALRPWETDSRTPRLRGLAWWDSLRTYCGVKTTLAKLEALLQSFAFAPLREVLLLRGGRNP